MPPQVDDSAAAAAAAEVAAMTGVNPATAAAAGGGGGGSRERDPTADEAVMGAVDTNGFEILDETGERVKARFLQFLMEYCEQVQTDNDTTTMQQQQQQQQDDDDNDEFFYPYVEQAHQMALKLQHGRSVALLEPEHHHDDENDVSSSSSSSSFPFATTMFVNYTHLLNHDVDLCEAVESEFVRFEVFLRRAVQQFVYEQCPSLNDGTPATPFFIAMHNVPHQLPVRELRMDCIGRLVAVSGTVTRTSEVRPELLDATFRCTKCGLLAEHVQQHYHYTRPTLCRNPRCQNKSPLEFTLELRQSEFVDWQKLRVQENSDEIPPGSMPRSMDIIVRNEMVEKSKAGDKCVFTGSLVVIPDGSALARAGDAVQASSNKLKAADAATGGGGGVTGLKALGVKELTYRTCFVASSVVQMEMALRTTNRGDNTASMVASFLYGRNNAENNDDPTMQEVAMEFTEEERNEIRNMKSSPHLYERMVESIAPTTFGHKEVKRGVLLMLLGGVHKTTQEGIRLRGDINVCIVGDPSTAKSQFLKYVHGFLPSRAVYTSGKASSAAGLTAAVMRDQDTGEYCIEAGALMLADNGICCIDEFEKMDPTDQVAIHEAMEQQTISITKAGIQATLNARASILAAANPIYGRYDRTKTLKANVALSAPILSRFDLFFVVLDECNEDADRMVAEHILKVHRCQDEAVAPPFTKEQMQRYIRFARTVTPKITPESQKVLVDCYRRLRQGDTLGRSRTAYRITVRQLESMIRLSEALARLHCDDVIQPAYVREAFRLLQKSIIHVETEDVTFDNEDDDDDDGPLGGGDDDDDMDDGNDGGQGGAPMETDEPTRHPGEYTNEDEVVEDSQPPPDSGDYDTQAPAPKPKQKKKKKKKTQITFEEFESISNAIATYLRSLESDDETVESKYLTWREVVNWYLEQREEEIGDSLEELERMRKMVNLVIRRLVNVDHVLMYIGDGPLTKAQEQETKIAVHPNYTMS